MISTTKIMLVLATAVSAALTVAAVVTGKPTWLCMGDGVLTGMLAVIAWKVP